MLAEHDRLLAEIDALAVRLDAVAPAEQPTEVVLARRAPADLAVPAEPTVILPVEAPTPVARPTQRVA